MQERTEIPSLAPGKWRIWLSQQGTADWGERSSVGSSLSSDGHCPGDGTCLDFCSWPFSPPVSWAPSFSFLAGSSSLAARAGCLVCTQYTFVFAWHQLFQVSKLIFPPLNCSPQNWQESSFTLVSLLGHGTCCGVERSRDGVMGLHYQRKSFTLWPTIKSASATSETEALNSYSFPLALGSHL